MRALAIRAGGTALLLRVSADGRSVTVRQLPLVLLPPQSPDVIDGIAVSPDGTELAVARSNDPANPNVLNPHGEVLLYPLKGGGAPRTWSAPHDPGLPWNPAWTGSGHLTFLWQDHLKGTVFFFTGRSQIRVLDTSAPGSSLLSSKVIATGSGTLGFIQAALAGPGDTPIIAATFRDVPSSGTSGTAILRLVGLSPAGAVSRVFTRHAIPYHSQGQMAQIDSSCQVLGMDATGRHTLAYCPAFGRVDNNTFTLVPHTATQASAAWW